MYTQNIQQYQKFIQGFFTLFDEIKEDNPIYNSRIGFNAVKFLIKHPNWNLYNSERKNEAREIILQEYYEIKKANQELQEKAKEVLKKYIYGDVNDGVKEVSIHGDHASIELKDNKKEFQISEFLNSDFCQKNGISGFSTLHSDGKSGMHGFVAEEGKAKKKVRHYVVTDGSYEMTLNWHDNNGKKCTIKIKIDKDGVDLTERNGVTAEQLEANKDVKIGGLFLHQIQFRERGQEREQESKQSSETFIESNGKNVGVQAPQFNSSYNSGIEEGFDNAQEAEDIHKLRRVAQKENLDVKVHNFQLPLAENLQNKKIRPPVPPRISSLRKDISDEQDPGNKKPDRNEQENSIFSNQQQEKGEDLFQDIKNFKRNNSWNADVEREEDKRPMFTTFGYTASGRKKTVAGKAPQVKSAEFAPLTQEIELKKVKESEDAKESGSTKSLNDVASILAWREKIELLRSESEYDEELFDLEDGGDDNEDKYLTLSNSQSDYEQEKSTKENKERGDDEQEEIRQENRPLEDNLTDIKTNDSGYSSPTYTSHYNFQVNSEQLKESLENIEPKKEDSGELEEVIVDKPPRSSSIEDSGKLLKKLDKELKEPLQQATKAKNSFSESVLGKIKEGKQYDSIRKWVEKKVAEQENADTNPTIDKNSELYKLLEKDATQLKAGVIEEERETEHIDSPDRNRVALANKNRKLLWTKRIAEQQEKDDGISI